MVNISDDADFERDLDYLARNPIELGKFVAREVHKQSNICKERPDICHAKFSPNDTGNRSIIRNFVSEWWKCPWYEKIITGAFLCVLMFIIGFYAIDATPLV